MTRHSPPDFWQGARGVGAMFRTARERLGLSQNRVGELTAERGAPVSRSAVSEIERGRNLPGVESLVALCEVLQLDPREVLERVIFRRGIAPDLEGCSFELLRRRGGLLFWNGQFRAADQVYAAAAEQLETDPSIEPSERRRLRARAQILRSWSLRHSGQIGAAEAAAKRALRLGTGNDELQVEGLVMLAWVHLDEGLLPLARAESEQAVRIAESAGAARGLSLASNLLGCCLFESAQIEEAAERFRRASDLAEACGRVGSHSRNEASIAGCLVRLGHPSAARRRYQRALELARSSGDRLCEVQLQLEYGRLALLTNEMDEAERRAAAALQIVAARDNPVAAFSGLWLGHQVKRRRSSGGSDRHTLARLRRLYPRVANNRFADAVREFRSEILGVADA